MIKVYTGIKGFTILLFFIAGVVLFLSIFFWGIAKAAGLLLPLLIVVSYFLIIVFLCGLLPAAFIKDLRPSLGVYSSWISHALGATTWMVSFLFVMKNFGFGGILLAFLFQLLAPIAIVAAVLKNSWPIAVHLSIWVVFTFGMRYYSQWLLKLNPHIHEKRDIIDVDVIEVRK